MEDYSLLREKPLENKRHHCRRKCRLCSLFAMWQRRQVDKEIIPDTLPRSFTRIIYSVRFSYGISTRSPNEAKRVSESNMSIDVRNVFDSWMIVHRRASRVFTNLKNSMSVWKNSSWEAEKHPGGSSQSLVRWTIGTAGFRSRSLASRMFMMFYFFCLEERERSWLYICPSMKN